VPTLWQSLLATIRDNFTVNWKIAYFAGAVNKHLDVDSVAQLVQANTQNSLHLAAAIRVGDAAKALALIAQLLSRNEPALRIVAH